MTTTPKHKPAQQYASALSSVSLDTNCNQLPDDIKRLSFKTNYVIDQISSPKPPVYYSHGSASSNVLHTRLRTDISHLNAHMYKIQKSGTPACSCGYPQENTAHYALTCPRYTSNRTVLFENVSNTLQYDFSQKSRSIQLQVPLDGTNLSGGDGRAVACHIQNYLQNTLRTLRTLSDFCGDSTLSALCICFLC